VANSFGNVPRITTVENRSIVSIVLSRKTLDGVSNRLQLIVKSGVRGDDPHLLWFGPDRLFLVSDTTQTDALIDSSSRALDGITHNALDYSSALVVLSIANTSARRLLATGTGIDLRLDRFPVGSCCRTRLAQIPVVIVVTGDDKFDLYVDRSFKAYLKEWLNRSADVLMKFDSSVATK
jgi:heterotetrameric sarcosine oxidase gamma subunit